MFYFPLAVVEVKRIFKPSSLSVYACTQLLISTCLMSSVISRIFLSDTHSLSRMLLTSHVVSCIEAHGCCPSPGSSSFEVGCLQTWTSSDFKTLNTVAIISLNHFCDVNDLLNTLIF
jgi:hypothetical protein